MTVRQRQAEHFWDQLSPYEHMVQFYASEEAFSDAVDGFVSSGLRGGEGVLVILTEGRRTALADRLVRRGLDIAAARANDQYVDVDANAMLERILIGGWPDPTRFNAEVTILMRRTRAGGRAARAHGG